MNQNDNACGAIARRASRDRSAAASMPVTAAVFIAYLIAMAMPVLPLHLHLGWGRVRKAAFESGRQLRRPLYFR